MIAAVLVLSALFGALDQYVGSLSAHPWMADVSGLSAPWLLLPFVVGALQCTPRRAMVVGVLATFVALVGYLLMTLSPVENAHLTWQGVAGFITGGNYRWFAGALITGPLFGWLGYQWRALRSAWPAIAIAAVVAAEPLGRLAYGNTIRSTEVRWAEVATGFAIGLALILGYRSHPEVPP